MNGAAEVLTAFYDLRHGPVSYDFVTWLVRAKAQAGTSRLHVVVVPDEDGLGGFSRHWGKHDAAAALWRLWHIVVASCPLMQATVTIAPTRALAESMKAGLCWWPQGKAHFMGPLIEDARRGAEIPKLRATDAARRYVEAFVGQAAKRLVTLTLRRQDTDPTRNTDPAEWAQIGEWIRGSGFEVIVLDDTNEALKAGRGVFELDPDLRLALYERAAMNLVGNNGPQELLKFSFAPYLAFGQAIGEGWTEHFRRYFSMEPGDQLPWARPDQRLVYAPAVFDVMAGEFGQWAGATK